MNRTNQLFALILGSGFLVQAIMAGGAVILSRFYQPEHFGDIAFYAGFSSLVAILSGLRFDFVAFFRNDFDKAVFYLLSLIVSLCVVLLIVAVLVAGCSFFSLEKSVVWIATFCFSTAIFYLGTQYLIATEDYRMFSGLRLVQAILQVAIGLALHKIAPDAGLLLAYSLSQLIVGAWIALDNRVLLLGIPKTEIERCWNACIRPALTNSFIVVLQYSTPFAPVLIGGFFFEKAEIGGYFLLSQAFTAPLSIFRRSLINLLNTQASTTFKTKQLLDSNRLILSGGVSLLCVALLSGSIVFYYFGEPITALIFGNQWRASSVLMLPLFIYFVIDAVLQPFTTLLPLWGENSKTIKYEAIRCIIVFVILPVSVVCLSLNFFKFLIAYFITMIAVYLLNFRAVCIALKK